MKKIEAIIKPHKLDAVKEAMDKVGVHGMTVTEVKGYGRQKGHVELYRGAEYQVIFKSKVKIEVVVSDAIYKNVMEAIRTSANTQSIGDGKIFVFDVAEAMRIRTGETDDAAI